MKRAHPSAQTALASERDKDPCVHRRDPDDLRGTRSTFQDTPSRGLHSSTTSAIQCIPTISAFSRASASVRGGAHDTLRTCRSASFTSQWGSHEDESSHNFAPAACSEALFRLPRSKPEQDGGCSYAVRLSVHTAVILEDAWANMLSSSP